MSKTGWANAVGSIGQGLLVFGANREKINYEKERDAHMLELEREQMAALKDYQRDALELQGREVDIAGDLATSKIAGNAQDIETSKAQLKTFNAETQATVEESRQKAVEFDNTQRLMGNEKITDPETGAVSYKYNEELFASTGPERMAARQAGSSVSQAVQTIQENTNSKIAARNDNPNDLRFMKEVKGEDGSVTKVLKTDSDLRAESNQEFQISQQSATTLQAKAEIDGLDDAIKAVNARITAVRDNLQIDDTDETLDPTTNLTDKGAAIRELEGQLNGLQGQRRFWSGQLSAGPSAPTYGQRSTVPSGNGLMQNSTGDTGPGVADFAAQVANGEIP